MTPVNEARLPVVAIIGRPNVGKSALFNRLIGRRKALVDPAPGVTRDRLYAELRWRGKPFRLTDTGGLEPDSADRLQGAIRSQVQKALEEASLALLVCDTRDGVTPLDRQVAEWLRRWGKPVLLVANKSDTEKDAAGAYEFSELGLGNPRTVSSLHGLGIGDLLDEIVRELESRPQVVPPEIPSRAGPRSQSPLEPALGSDRGRGERGLTQQGAGRRRGRIPDPLRVAIVGRPNVGKSSLINRLLKEERLVVDESAGTTRDPVEVPFSFRGRRYALVDTAGLRARRRLKSRVDAVARIKAVEAIDKTDICVGVLDARLGIVRDDLRILDHAVSSGKPLCLAVNKWDLLPRSTPQASVAAQIAQRAPFLRFAPVVCVSAKTGFQVLKLLDWAEELAEQAYRRIPPDRLRALRESIPGSPRTPVSLKNARLLRLIQTGVAPPTFELAAQVRARLKDSDIGYLERILRREGGYPAVPIRVRLKTRRAG